MFDFTKEELMNKQAESKAMKMFSRMMSKAILESENTPEYMKFSVLAMDKSEDVQEAIHELVVHYVEAEDGVQANAETMKKLFEYLELVELGIKQFKETTPFVALTKEEE